MSDIKNTKSLEDVLLDILSAHKGKENAIKSVELEKFLNVKGSALRNLINKLRTNGNPICSDATGYYVATNSDEFKKTIAQLSSRKNSIEKAINGMMGIKE